MAEEGWLREKLPVINQIYKGKKGKDPYLFQARLYRP